MNIEKIRGTRCGFHSVCSDIRAIVSNQQFTPEHVLKVFVDDDRDLPHR